jgi:hypothetical protein
MSTTYAGQRRSERTFIQEAVAVSGARPTDNVTIAGKRNVDVVIDLMRRGFSNVLCQSAENGPHVSPPADLLIAPDLKSEADLINVLTRLGRDLRPRGVVVTTCAWAFTAVDERRLRRLFMAHGFVAVERIAGRGDAQTVWCAHKGAASLRRAA